MNFSQKEIKTPERLAPLASGMGNFTSRDWNGSSFLRSVFPDVHVSIGLDRVRMGQVA